MQPLDLDEAIFPDRGGLWPISPKYQAELGLGLTLILMRVVRGMLVGFESGNAGKVWIAVGLVSLTAASACWLPARRAARIDPVSALRQD